MVVGPLQLYWKKQLVGVISEAEWSDFPWLAGKFKPQRLGKRLRAVLKGFALQAGNDEPKDPPFEPELLENWSIVKPDRSRVDLLCPPLVDFTTGAVEWRE